MFKKHEQKRNFRLRMQDTMLVYVFCLLSFTFNKSDDHRYLRHTHTLKSFTKNLFLFTVLFNYISEFVFTQLQYKV